MSYNFSGRKRTRRTFSRIPSVAPMPNLIEVQKSSYAKFLQMDTPSGERKDQGIQAVLKSVFPIKDFSDHAELHYVSYEFEAPKYDVEECQQRGMTYAAPLKVTLRLIVFDVEEDIKQRDVRDIKEQNVYMGDMPLMTENGTFVINGTERVFVSQMHRSPGAFFDHDKGKTHSSGKFLFTARVIPYRGSWLDFEFDAKDLVYVRIDRRRKLPVTTLLYAIDMTTADIFEHFYDTVTYTLDKKGWRTPFDAERTRGTKLLRDLVNAKNGKKLADSGAKMTPRLNKKLVEAKITEQLVPAEALLGRFISGDLINDKTGEIYCEAGDEITEELLESLVAAGSTELPTLAIDGITVGPYIRNTLALDKCSNREEALLEIYRVLRPGEPPTIETAETLFWGLFSDPNRYDLSAVGRVKLNARLDLDTNDEVRILRKEDILAVVKTLVNLKDGRGDIDDIDHLGNRRVRSVGELLENQYNVGLLRMERAIRERMSSVEIDSVMPHDLINAKPAAGAVREFFGTSQLSQFMDQTNPLSEITH